LQNARVLLNAYQQGRKVTAAGFDAWPTMPRAAALRFRLSRLQDKYFPRGGEITHIKDPDEFKLILQDRVENSDQMSKMWDHP